MNLDVFKYLLPIGAVSLGLGMLLGWPRKNGKEKYDERQLIEQGRASQIAMMTGMVYVLCIYAGSIFELILESHMTVLLLFGMMLMHIVYEAWCIFHDAYLRSDQDGAMSIVGSGVLGLIWVANAWVRWELDMEFFWISVFLAMGYMSRGIFYGIRVFWLRVQNSREAEE